MHVVICTNMGSKKTMFVLFVLLNHKLNDHLSSLFLLIKQSSGINRMAARTAFPVRMTLHNCLSRLVLFVHLFTIHFASTIPSSSRKGLAKIMRIKSEGRICIGSVAIDTDFLWFVIFFEWFCKIFNCSPFCGRSVVTQDVTTRLWSSHPKIKAYLHSSKMEVERY